MIYIELRLVQVIGEYPSALPKEYTHHDFATITRKMPLLSLSEVPLKIKRGKKNQFK
jgi:hypothetical protein